MSRLSGLFEGAAAKILTKVELAKQHEFQGVQKLREVLGTNDGPTSLDARFIRLEADEDTTAFSVDAFVTWSNVRRDNPNRSPEFHLYYGAPAEPVVHSSSPGDMLFICKLKGQAAIVVIIVGQGSSLENSLLWLFGLDHPSTGKPVVSLFEERNDKEIGWLERFVLEKIGFEDVEDAPDRYDELLNDKFGLTFPTTAVFSALARELAGSEGVIDDPDATLMSWFSTEDFLFKRLEKKIVASRIEAGFVESSGAADVEAFIQFSLSVQNRRKSRAGRALENHLAAIFNAHNLEFDTQATTEGKKRPDFLFPSSADYHNSAFPANRLTLLAAKSSCKERWRQVLSEAARIDRKHLLTLEPGISVDQTSEMRNSNLTLIVPTEIQATYLVSQRTEIMNLQSFIELVRGKVS